jgi:hypothetical protein
MKHIKSSFIFQILYIFLITFGTITAFALDIPSNLNPKYNSSINPTYNSSINPTYNSSINPTYNSSINPKYNSSINPTYNSSLNPRYNSSIDPTLSRWSGFYTFDKSNDLTGIATRANREFLLLFGLNGRWQGYLASNSDSGYNWFSIDGEWRGYCLSNTDGGLNIFTIDGDWIGFMK